MSFASADQELHESFSADGGRPAPPGWGGG
jgi:hypothetical protein